MGVCAVHVCCVGMFRCEFLRVSEFLDQTREHQTLGLVGLKLRSFWVFRVSFWVEFLVWSCQRVLFVSVRKGDAVT